MSTVSSASSFAAAGLDKDKFLQLLVTQIRNQNPLEPTSNEQFIQQLTSFSTLEATQNTNSGLETLIQLESINATMSQLSQATAFIGKQITYTDPDTGEPKNGVVDSVGIDQGAVIAKVGNKSVPLILINGVKAASTSNN